MLEYQKAEQLGNPRVFGGVPMPQTKCEEGLRDLNARPPVKSANKSRKKKLRKNPRVFGGVPMPQTKCEEGLRDLNARPPVKSANKSRKKLRNWTGRMATSARFGY